MDNKEIYARLRSGIKRIIPFEGIPGKANSDSFDPSSHPQHELLLALGGSSETMLNGEVYQIQPGDLILIDGWVPHSNGYRKCDTNLTHLLGSAYDANFGFSVLQTNFEGNYHLVSNVVFLEKDISALITRKWAAFTRTKGIHEREMLVQTLNLAFSEIAYELEFSPGKNSKLSSKILSVCDYIQRMNGRDCSNTHLGKMFGYSQTYLAQRFRDETGSTIRDFIIETRIKYVRNALTHGLRQNEIAYELGFSSPASFWIWLQKHRDQIFN